MIVIEQTPFHVRTTLDSLHVLLQQKASEKKIGLKFHIDKNIPDTIIGDPTRLMQILLNLADNAIKFTEQGSVEINANRLNATGDTVTIEFLVKDTGEGIPEDKFSVIFDRFTQVSAETTRKHGGTGLGLSIVKSLVALQHGTLSLKSEKNKGSVFSFTITYVIAKKAGELISSEIQSTDAPQQKALQILLAEDNPLNRLVVLKAFKNYGIEIDLAEYGKIAVEKMKEKHYDLILMDIQMPEMDGHEATRIIRNELKSGIPIIALTAHAMNEEKEKCFRSGMNDFVSKPFNAKDLYRQDR